MHTIRYFALFVNYRGGFNINGGDKKAIDVDEEPSFTQSSMSSPLVFDSVKNTTFFHSLNDSNNFGTVDYDAHTNTNIEDSINHIFTSLTIQEMNTLHHICELE